MSAGSVKGRDLPTNYKVQMPQVHLIYPNAANMSAAIDIHQYGK